MTQPVAPSSYRRFGRLGWEVSTLGFGMWGIGDWTPDADTDAAAALDAAIEAGCTFFDTALLYGDGRSEQVLGDAVRRHPDRGLRVATKVPPRNGRFPAISDDAAADAYPADYVIECAQRSREHLGVERIDLLQLHAWTDAWVEDNGWRTALEQLKGEGVIDGFGISINRWEPENVLAALETGLVDAVQAIYNVFDQAPEDRLLAECAARDIAFIARVPFDEGSLTGSLRHDSRWPEGDWRNGYFTPSNLEATLERVGRLEAELPEGMGLPELALRFVLSEPRVTTVIPGTRRVAHVQRNVAAAQAGPLPTELLARLKAHRWDRRLPVAPWHTTVEEPRELVALEGRELGVSDWVTLDQATIDGFAEVTRDKQWIHVDTARAADGPFGSTIAHGYLTLSLCAHFMEQVLDVHGVRMAVNYGLDRVRFPSPVRSGARVRAHAGLLSTTPVDGGVQAVVRLTIEIDGEAKPACVADAVMRYVFV